MDVAMTPREIQQRIRAGDSLEEVTAASGLPASKVEIFAAPIIAEREHTTAEALAAPVRRRGETASARRLSQTAAENLLDRNQDIDYVTWDSWRRSDGRWILQGSWAYEGDHVATFVFDPRGRFSVADNDEARLLIGDLPLGRALNPDAESTVGLPRLAHSGASNLSDETTLGLMVEETSGFPPAADEDSLRSDIDLLYSMISTIDEDSVRIFRGLRQPIEESVGEGIDDSIGKIEQPPLIEAPEPVVIQDEAPHPTRKRKRASVPSWDDIIFGGQA
ncbi:MAG: DUF3071 domain-containing protein [Propionibacteriaceae bacterium]|jgi:hypothetical protein|nr:DUF3071 domain-containing protein [Propionibacteriaceae bacterium]